MSKTKKQIDCLCLFSIIFSSFGWIVENITKILSKGVIDNRYHLLPFIGVYGLVSFALAILGGPDKLKAFGLKLFKKETKTTKIVSNVLYLTVICLFVGVGEIAVGTFFEHVADVTLWNYSHVAFHITKYTSLKSILGFGVGIFFISKMIFYPSYNSVMKNWSKKDLSPFKYLYGVILLDMVIMMTKTIVLQQKMRYWTINVESITNDKVSFIILFVIGYVILLMLLLYVVSKIPNLFTKKTIRDKSNIINSFAILIAARDESSVIESTLNGIYNSNYPKDKLHTYVMVSSSDDPTIQICEKFPYVTCLVKENDLPGKGAVLDELFSKIENKYDLYCVLDADNIVEPTFFKEINSCFTDDIEVVVGSRNNKNWNSNWVSATSGLTFSCINFLNSRKERLGDTNLITGTGFAIKKSLKEKMGGWPFKSMTEDYEFSKYLKENQIKTRFAKDAIFYDEQPISYKVSIIQRSRWVVGFFSNNKSGFSNPSTSFSISAALIYIALLVIAFVAIPISFILKGDTLLWCKLALVMITLVWVAIFLVSVVLFVTDKRRKNIKLKTIFKASLLHPVFLFGYVIAIVRSLKHEITWDKIEHSIKEVK